jgi:hypothetical protein
MEFKLLCEEQNRLEMLKSRNELTEQGVKMLAELNQALQLLQTAVSSQRELLFAYEKMRTNHIIGGTDDWRYSNVDLFLSK